MPARISLWKLTDFEKAAGAETFARTLSCFSSPLNGDVEDYLKNPKRATNASHMSSSVTYLVLDSQSYDLLGYFTLMMKAYSVEALLLSSKNRRLVERFSQVSKDGKCVVPVYLIAQLGISVMGRIVKS